MLALPVEETEMLIAHGGLHKILRSFPVITVLMKIKRNIQVKNVT